MHNDIIHSQSGIKPKSQFIHAALSCNYQPKIRSCKIVLCKLMLQGEIDTPTIRKTCSPLLYISRLLLAIVEADWWCDCFQLIMTGFASSLLSFGNIRDLLQWHEWTTYSSVFMLSVSLKLCLWSKFCKRQNAHPVFRPITLYDS